jgi:hypothetical protein
MIQPLNTGGPVVFAISLTGCETATLSGLITMGWSLFAANAGAMSSTSHASNGKQTRAARRVFMKSSSGSKQTAVQVDLVQVELVQTDLVHVERR